MNPVKITIDFGNETVREYRSVANLPLDHVMKIAIMHPGDAEYCSIRVITAAQYAAELEQKA